MKQYLQFRHSDHITDVQYSYPSYAAFLSVIMEKSFTDQQMFINSIVQWILQICTLYMRFWQYISRVEVVSYLKLELISLKEKYSEIY